MRMTLLAACISFVLGSPALAQSGRLPVTVPPPVNVVRVNSAAPGAAQGYIFWARNDFKYNDQTVCQDLTIRIEGAGTDNQLTYITAGPYAGCAYSMGGLPEGADLKLRIRFWPSQLSPAGFAILETNDDLGELVLPGPTSGPACSKTPPAILTNPSPSELTAPIQVCGDYIYNFNIHLYNPANGMPATGNIPVTRVRGPVRVAPGTPVQSGASNGMLLAPGSQQTMLGGASSSAGNGSSGMPAVQRQAITNGTITDGIRSASTGQVGPSQTMSVQGNGSGQPAPAGATNPTQTTTGPMSHGGSNPGPAPVPWKGNGRNEYEAITAQRGVTQDPAFANWANSGQAGNGSPNGTSRTGTSLSKMEHAPLNNGNDVAMLCAQDPSFRVLGISPASGGSVTITVDRQYTIWGCSFGTPPPVKAPSPAGPQMQNRTVVQANANGNTNAITIYTAPPPDHIAWFVFPKIESWSNNEIVLTVSDQQGTHPGSPTGGLPVPAELWLTRGDGQTTIYGHEGGFYFKPAN